MNIHIVKMNESIKSIASKYQVSVNDLISVNTHLSQFDSLVPGTKLYIPILNEKTYEILEDTEPIIETYYPKPKEEKIPKVKKEEMEQQENETKKDEQEKAKETEETKMELSPPPVEDNGKELKTSEERQYIEPVNVDHDLDKKYEKLNEKINELETKIRYLESWIQKIVYPYYPHR